MSNYANWANGASAQDVRNAIKKDFETLEDRLKTLEQKKIDNIKTSRIHVYPRDWSIQSETSHRGVYLLDLTKKLNGFTKTNKILNIIPHYFGINADSYINGYLYSDIQIPCTIEVIWV